MLQPCLRKAQALKPASPSFDFNNMFKCFVGRGPEPSAPCRAVHSLCCPKSCSEAAAVVSWEYFLWTPEQDDREIKDKSESLSRVLHKALCTSGEEFGELSYCCLNTYSEQNSFLHAPGLHECHAGACKRGMCMAEKRSLNKSDP